jgi:L-ascorbate metabolism protein UlaG (beta-lactamase superfamily)
MARSKKGRLTYQWLGTAGLHLSDGRTAVLIDPYVSRHGMARVFLGMKLPPRRDLIASWSAMLADPGIGAVAVSHSHFDHALDAPLFAAETGAPLLGSPSTAMIARGHGLDAALIDTVMPGQSRKVGDFTITFIESRHGPAFLGRVPYPGEITAPVTPPAPATAYRLGHTFSLLIEHPLAVMVHHGSAGYIEGMYRGIGADCLFLGIAGRGDTASYLDNVAAPLGVRTLIPLHFDNFFRPLDAPLKYLPGLNLGEFMETASRYPSLKVALPTMAMEAQLP